MGILVFDSQAHHRKNGDDPEQDQGYQQLRTLLEHEPAWNDSDITELTGDSQGL